MTDLPDEIEQAEKADTLRETAAERDAHYFMGQRLFPLSFSRQAAIQRVHCGGGEVEAAVMLVFMCVCTPETIEQYTRYAENHAKFNQLKDEWAQAQGITIQVITDGPETGQYASQATRQLVAVANEIWDELSASNFKAVDPNPAQPIPSPPNE